MKEAASALHNARPKREPGKEGDTKEEEECVDVEGEGVPKPTATTGTAGNAPVSVSE